MKATAPCPTGWLGPFMTTVDVTLLCGYEDEPVTVAFQARALFHQHSTRSQASAEYLLDVRSPVMICTRLGESLSSRTLLSLYVGMSALSSFRSGRLGGHIVGSGKGPKRKGSNFSHAIQTQMQNPVLICIMFAALVTVH